MPDENVASSRKWRSLGALAALAAVAVLVLAACGGGSSSGGGETGGSETSEGSSTESSSEGGGGKEPIDISFLTAQTGGCGPIDSQNLIGLEIAGEKLNEKGITIAGKEYEFVWHVGDTKGENTEAINVVRSQIAEGIQFFIGPNCAALSGIPGALALLEQSGSKVLSLNNFGSAAIAAGDKAAEEAAEGSASNMFSTTLAASEQAVRDSYLVEIFPEIPKKVFILLQNDEGGEFVAKGFEEGLDKQGIEHESALYDPSTKDFSGFLAKVKAYGPDVLVSGYYPEQSLAVLRQTLQTQAAPAYLGYGQPIEDALKTAIGKPIPIPAVWDQYPVSLEYTANPALKELSKEIEEKTGKPNEPTSSYAASQYDFVGMLAAAMEKAGSLEPDAVSKALTEIEYESAWFGMLKYNASHHVPTTVEGCYIEPPGEVHPCVGVSINGLVEE